MYDLIKYHIPEAIRIEVLQIENGNQYLSKDGEVRKFSVDPHITPLSVLQSLLVRAFNLHSDFSLSYLCRDSYEYSPIESDIDLDSAYLKHSEPSLQIRMSVDKTNSLPDWDIITIADVARTQANGISIANTLITQVEKFMGRAFDSSRNALTNEMITYPLNDNQFRNLLDREGKVRCSRELRIAVYRRGVDPGLRKVVWKHLLNVYPPGLTAQQRIDFIKLKCETYYQMRNLWQSNKNDQTVEQTLHMVRKDVMRTDRCHHYYYGSSDEDNENVTALLNILTTFALNHRDKYCQGMSDLASPLLYAMKGEPDSYLTNTKSHWPTDEAHAYICFCALMTRLSDNFNSNGESMSRKFAHLTQLLQYYDPEFYSYLRIQGAHELLFCYRWILLELKREFPFDDTLRMLEVLWSSIPPLDLNTSLRLFDDNFLYIPNKIQQMKPKFRTDVLLPSKMEEKPMASKLDTKPMSRPRSLRFLPQFLSTDSRDLDSPDEDEFAKNLYRCPPPRNCLAEQFSIDTEDPLSESTDNALNNNPTEAKANTSKIDEKSETNENTNTENLIKTLRNVHCNGEYNEEIEDLSEKPMRSQTWSCPVGLARSISCESLKAEKARTESYGSQCSELGSSFSEVNTCSTKSSSCSSLVILSSESSSLTKSTSLLSPDQLGSNDSFMLFLCLTILLQNRDRIISNNLDANDIQMFFDGLVRKNDVVSVLDFARQLFHSYLSHWHQDTDSRT